MNFTRSFSKTARLKCQYENIYQLLRFYHGATTTATPLCVWTKFIRECRYDHNAVNTRKNVEYTKPWSPIVWLLCKSINKETEDVICKNVLRKQRSLVDLIEAVKISYRSHNSLVNFPLKINQYELFEKNRFALLLGDYHLSTVMKIQSKICHKDVNYVMSCALRDLFESEFYGDQNAHNEPLPAKPIISEGSNDTFVITADTTPLKTEGTLGLATKEWTVRNILGGASLLGRGCQSAMILGGKSVDLQERSYLFGCHLGLAWLAASELLNVTSNNENNFSLVSAPVLFALEENKGLYTEVFGTNTDFKDINYQHLRWHILRSQAIQKTKSLSKTHAISAMKFFDSLMKNSYTEILIKLVTVLK